jgi:hypothetical protein
VNSTSSAIRSSRASDWNQRDFSSSVSRLRSWLTSGFTDGFYLAHPPFRLFLEDILSSVEEVPLLGTRVREMLDALSPP